MGAPQFDVAEALAKVPTWLRNQPLPPRIDDLEYDPREWGADCDNCILREMRAGPPVPPELHPGSKIIVVGEAPGETEVKEGRPFASGPSWIVLEKHGLNRVGLKRHDVTLANCLGCRPPKNKLALVMAEWRNRNKELKKAGMEEKPDPVTCCFPRLAHLVSHFDCIVPMGTTALKDILATRTGIMDNRGTMHVTRRFGREALALPTFHPAHVARAMRNRYAFRIDWGRAVRYFHDGLRWTDPDMTGLFPSVTQVKRYLSQEKRLWLYDVETDGLEPMTANMRCIGIGDSDGGVVIPFLSIDGHTTFYSDSDTREMKDVLRWFFTSPKHRKAGHNAGFYDRIAVEQFLGVTPKPLLDTLLLHRLGMWAELQHSLGFLGSTLTDVRAWKAGHTATRPENDRQLWVYNLTDVVVNARVTQACVDQVKRTEQQAVYKLDAQMQDVCVGMHRLGLAVDQGLTGEKSGQVRPTPMKLDKTGQVVVDKDTGKPVPDLSLFGRSHWHVKLEAERIEAVTNARRILARAGEHALAREFDPGVERDDYTDDFGNVDEATLETVSSFNPNSPNQLREVLFVGRPWRLGVVELTKTTGAASTGDAVLRTLRVDATVPHIARLFIDEIRKARRATKLLGYVKAVRYEPGAKGCSLLQDGYLHPFWNATGKGSGDGGAAVTGRLTSSPNVQNWRYALRSMVVADLRAAITGQDPRYVYVGADLDQIELRLIAALSGCRKYLEVFERGMKLAPGHPLGDPHRVTMITVFGETAVKTCDGQPVCHNGIWDKGSGTYKKYRDLAKRVQYASQYGADPPTVHRVITSAEDKKGVLIYAELPLRKVRKMVGDWKHGVPEITGWWDDIMRKYAAQGYLADPITGRRRYFLDGAQPKKSGIDPHLLNYEVQSSAAGHMNQSGVRVRDAIPFDFREGTGLCGQFHDAFMVRVRAQDAREAGATLRREMAGEFMGTLLTAEPSSGLRWLDT